MRDSFPGFYRPSDDDLKALWHEGTIVLDANVLLNAYRLPKGASDEFIAALKKMSDRIWIPFQFALEFQRNRLSVVADQRTQIETTLAAVIKQIAEAKLQVEKLELEKAGLDIDVDSLKQELTDVGTKIEAAITKVHRSMPEVSASDDVRDRLDLILAGKIGDAPSTADELKALTADGDRRYAAKIPPGFADAKRDDHPDGSSYAHCGLVYERKWGDLIAWRQVINHSKTTGIKKLLLVTADVKADWWWREKGKTIGPHPELVKEAKTEGAIDLFWMYPFDGFLRRSVEFLGTAISATSIEEAEQVTEAAGNIASAATSSFRRMLQKGRSPSVAPTDIATTLGLAITSHLTFLNPHLKFVGSLGNFEYLFDGPTPKEVVIAKALAPKKDPLSSSENFLHAIDEVNLFLRTAPEATYAIYLLASIETFKSAGKDRVLFEFVRDAVRRRFSGEDASIFVGSVVGSTFAPYYSA